MPLVMPLCPRCRSAACAYQRPAFYGRMPRASSLCGECLRLVGADMLGSVIHVQPLPVRQGGSPAMPLPELEGGTSDETIAPEPDVCGLPIGGCTCILNRGHVIPCLPRHYGPCPEPHDDCTRAVIEHGAPAPVTDLEAALRASLRPLAPWASKPAARHVMTRDLDRDERARCRRIGRTVLA